MIAGNIRFYHTSTVEWIWNNDNKYDDIQTCKWKAISSRWWLFNIALYIIINVLLKRICVTEKPTNEALITVATIVSGLMAAICFGWCLHKYKQRKERQRRETRGNNAMSPNDSRWEREREKERERERVVNIIDVMVKTFIKSLLMEMKKLPANTCMLIVYVIMGRIRQKYQSIYI